MKNHAARIERLNALAEKLGRLSGEAHNLIDDLKARMVVRRANERSAAEKTIKSSGQNRSERHIVSH